MRFLLFSVNPVESVNASLDFIPYLPSRQETLRKLSTTSIVLHDYRISFNDIYFTGQVVPTRIRFNVIHVTKEVGLIDVAMEASLIHVAKEVG